MLAIIYFIGFVIICSRMANENKRKVDELLEWY